MVSPFKKEIVQRVTRNFLDIQVLKLIKKEPSWGYKIMRNFESRFGVKVGHGVLYPLLKSMEKRGLIRGRITSYGRRVRKVYEITEKGNRFIVVFNEFLREQNQT